MRRTGGSYRDVLLRRSLPALAMAVGVCALIGSFFTVDATEYGLVTRFGRVVRVISEPGLYVTVPFDRVVRLDKRFAPEQLAQVKEGHTASGRHISRSIPYPDWVPPEVIKEARKADEQEALRVLGRFFVHSQVAMERPSVRSFDGN